MSDLPSSDLPSSEPAPASSPAPATAAPPPESPTVATAPAREASANADPLARFILERQISRAPLALSWLATDTAAPGTPRVLFKQFTATFTELITDRESFAQRVAQITARADRRLASLRWSGWYDDQFYAAFEWHDDDPLDQFIAASQGRIALVQRYGLIHVAAAAVDVLHDAGLLHLGLTPASFGVARGDERQVRLLDWGLMLPLQAAQRLSGPFPGAWLDAAPYASAELLASEPPDTSDDAYSLSCIAHEVLTGKHPFARRLARDALAMTLEPAPIPALGTAQAKALADGLALQRERRSARVADLISAFDPAHAPAFDPTPAPTDETVAEPRDNLPPPSRARSSWRPLAALAMALVVVFALVWRSTTSGDKPAGSSAPLAHDRTKSPAADTARSATGARTPAQGQTSRAEPGGTASSNSASESHGRQIPVAPSGISGLPNPAVRIEMTEPQAADATSALPPGATDKPRPESRGASGSETPAVLTQDRSQASKAGEAARVAASEIPQPDAARPGKSGAAECRNCDCAALEYKRSFTTDPMRPEEQRFLAQQCRR